MIDEVPLPGGRFGWFERLVAATRAKPHVQRLRLQATNDVERSRRALRLVFANWLAQVDKPASQRAAIAIEKPTLIYAPDPTAPPAARAVVPEILDNAIEKTSLAHVILRPGALDFNAETPMVKVPWEGDGPLAREQTSRAALIVKLAAELYRRERGTMPENAGALLRSYLKELPAGIAPEDLLAAGVE
jgi:hypothetical protein